ncbi:MAG: murA [Ignavibacteria bacterium]|nr:murA [Ignavibacteria bacterium]
MDKFIIEGGARLSGSLKISGAKNGSLALMPATLLAPGNYNLYNTPNLSDVRTMSRLLGSMGVNCELTGSELTIDSTQVTSYEAPYEHVKKMRASFYVLGPLVARYGTAKVSLPGGCAWGPRPVDLHLKGIEKLGAKITLESGYVLAECERLHGAKFHFDISSVGATGNVLMAATLAKGASLLTNAAIEPEITALAVMLQKMGAKISGIGTSVLEIEGVDELHPADETTIPDRIEAATFLIAAAITKGEIELTGVIPEHLAAVITKLEDSGCIIESGVGGQGSGDWGLGSGVWGLGSWDRSLESGENDVIPVPRPPFPDLRPPFPDPRSPTPDPRSPTPDPRPPSSNENRIKLRMDSEPKPIDITTGIYPGFPTDVQAQWSAYMLAANGSTRITDTIYHDRFKHVPELARLGAEIEVIDNSSIVHGGKQISGAIVMSSDLRASAGLIIAALIAKGETEVLRVYHIDRGYEEVEVKLQSLGANIKRVKTELI